MTGVSGGGKSSLVLETLYKALAKTLHGARSVPGPHKKIDGLTFIDKIVDIDCPRCGKKMDKIADPKQYHIWYEACEEHGMYFDAGEFTDYKYETFLDKIRGLIKGKRN